MNRDEIEKDIQRNRAQRLEFVTWYAQWVKRTPNKVWSRQQREMVDSVLEAANRERMEQNAKNDNS